MHLPWRPVVAAVDGPPILTSLTEREAAHLAGLSLGAKVLEVGAAYGFSTVTLALQASEVVSIDPHNTHLSYEILCNNLVQYRVADKVDVRRQMSQQALPELLATGYTFDLIFIDGDHTAAGCGHDIEWALKLIAPGGTIAVHDVMETCCCPEVQPMADLLLGAYEVIDTMGVVKIS